MARADYPHRTRAQFHGGPADGLEALVPTWNGLPPIGMNVRVGFEGRIVEVVEGGRETPIELGWCRYHQRDTFDAPDPLQFDFRT